uniref:Uncharacterized protein n=1 Tax=Rhizophora mucronata TaxID=61149 RepID=A0A2P2PGR8_RHIMU
MNVCVGISVNACIISKYGIHSPSAHSPLSCSVSNTYMHTDKCAILYQFANANAD